MGRKRDYPPIVFLPVFTEGEKLTKEQKEWLLKKGKRNGNKRQELLSNNT